MFGSSFSSPAPPHLFWASLLTTVEPGHGKGGSRRGYATGSSRLVYDATWWQRLWTLLFLTSFFPLRSHIKPFMPKKSVTFRRTHKNRKSC